MEFDERELKEIKLSLIYADQFAHGTAGHNRLMLIAKLAQTSHNEQVKIVVQNYELNKKSLG